MNYQGTVNFFDIQKGFGKIRTDALDEPVFVHISNIFTIPRRSLIPGEPVSFDIEKTNKGLSAINVHTLEKREQGSVIKYDHKKGYGSISGELDSKSYFAHHTEIITDKEFRVLEEGDDVTFVPDIDENNRLKAIRVFKDLRMPWSDLHSCVTSIVSCVS